MSDLEKLIFDFLDGHIDLIDFENTLYSLDPSSLEFDQDIYTELISLNFKDSSSHSFITSFLLEQKVVAENYNAWKVCSLFKQAFVEKGSTYPTQKIDSQMKNLPNTFLEIYGELEVGEVGEGIDIPKSNVLFLKRPLSSDLDPLWHDILGNVSQIGFAHNYDIILFLDMKGVFYMYIEMTDEMFIGGDFQETMYKLLLGLDYGKKINQ